MESGGGKCAKKCVRVMDSIQKSYEKPPNPRKEKKKEQAFLQCIRSYFY